MDSTPSAGKAESKPDSIQSNEHQPHSSVQGEWYKGLYDKVPCCCLIVSTTRVILDANRFACECLGYSERELIETSIYSLFTPSDRERLLSALSNCKQGLTGNVSEEFWLVAKNAKTLLVKLTLDVLQKVSDSPVILVIFEELTERQRLEESSQDVQSKVQLLADAFPGKVSYIDAQKRYQLVSKRYQEWSLISCEEILGKTLEEILSPQQYRAVEEYIELSLSGKTIQYDNDVLFNDGKRRYLLISQVPHFNQSGDVLGFFVFCQDITERKQAEDTLREFNQELENRVRERTAELEQALEALREAEEEVRLALLKEQELSELKSRFISTTSHEFRTPLTTILSSSQMLKRYRQKMSEDSQLTHFHRIQSAVDRMTQMLNDLLTLSQIEAGKLEFNPSPLDLEQFCRELVEELQQCEGEQCALALDYQSQCIPVILDDKLLRHILTNLLSNAFKYSPKGSTVRLSVLEQDGLVRFEIQDRGIGIPKEGTKRLFEPFYRATNVGTIQGTGLGLSIVKQCVDLHGGKIAVNSIVGQGTTFTVTLPLGNTRDSSKE